MNNHYLKYLIVIITLTLVQCKKDDVDAIVVINVETEYLIDFKEILCAEGDSLNLIIQSSNGYNCGNLQIVHTLNRHEDIKLLDILIKGVEVPTYCNPGSFHPSIILGLHDLKYQTYEFELNLNNKLLNYEKITHLPERYFISFPDKNGVKLLHNNIKKIPKDLVWGQISLDESLDGFLVEYIEDDLLNSTGNSISTPYLANGYYSYFNIVDNLVEMIAPPDNTLLHKKQIKFEVSDLNLFSNKIDELRNTYGSLLKLDMYSGKGDTF